VFDAEEIKRIPAESIKAIDVVNFVDLEEIDPVYYQRPYYLAPEQTGIKAYQLLTQALSEAGKVGIAKVSLRDKERLATLRVKDGVMVLETMHWPDEIRAPEFEELDKKPDIRKEERDMAQSLIDNLSNTFDPSRFTDEYRERLEGAIQAKIDGKEIAAAPEKAPTQVIDLMEALKASVEATKKSSKDGEAKAKSTAKAKSA
jgi:DNA end-binding protein Ku